MDSVGDGKNHLGYRGWPRERKRCPQEKRPVPRGEGRGRKASVGYETTQGEK